MIYSVEIKDPNKTIIYWLGKVPVLAKPKEFIFKPGVNILWGMNGSGKSTLLKLMARLFHCEQSGNPVVTMSSIGELTSQARPMGVPKEIDYDSVVVKHDGQGVRHYDPLRTTGLICGGFDYDFSDEGLQNCMAKESSGQSNARRFTPFAMSIKTNVVPKVQYKAKLEKGGFIDNFLKANSPLGMPTILLDEPDKGYDLKTQHILWDFIKRNSTTHQFIIAAHSFFALKIKDANYIDLDNSLPEMNDIFNTLSK